MRSFKKVLLGAVTAMVLVAVLAVGSASAVTPAPDPTGVIPSQGRYTQDANAPYLAWQGEHVRLVWCNKFGNGAQTEWKLVDPLNWPDFAPSVDSLSVQTVAGTGCVKATWISDKPGLATIKAIVHDGNAVYTKDFLVGWMTIKSVVATGGGDVNAADFCDKQDLQDTFTAESVKLLGPYSNCWHNYPPIDPRHRINIIVKGTLPLEADFSNYGLGSSLTLPDDWGKWAAAAATSTTDHDFAHAMSNWDIHDDSLLTEGHTITYPLGSQCPADPLVEEKYKDFDAVDNCTTGNTHGGFSTVFGTQSTAGTTIGPFDPIYSNDTMLSDGKVDAGDAPMPALQLDVSIKDNDPTNKTDIGGVGYLFPSWKSEVYSRDGKGGNIWTGDDANPVVPHNYYAPFYSQFIPATSRGASPNGSPYGTNPPPSGIEGTGTNGFGGFLTSGEYRNWGFAWTTRRNAYGDTHCLFSQVLPGLAERFRQLPSGYNAVSVYSDESGEANINFVPGLGMYFDNLTAANLNKNGGCDLENVDPIGTAQVDVVGRYPFQQPTARPVAADPAVKFTVHNLFKKTLTVFSKGVDKNNIVSNSVARIVLTHAQDIDGSPLAYELVCWMADGNAAGFRVFAGDLPMPTADKPDATITLDPWHALLTTYQDPWGLGRLCTFTDRWGNSAIEVYNSNKTPVDVIAEYVNEGILRDTIVHFETPPTLGQTGTTSPDGPPSSHVPTPTQLSQAVAVGATGPVLATKSTTVAKTIKSKQTKKLVLHKIRYAQVVTPFHQKAKLLVRVNGKAGMVKLRITILSNGKKHTYFRFIPANRKMTVKNLSIPAKTAKVTVKLIGL